MAARAEVELRLRNAPFQRGMDQVQSRMREVRGLAARGFSFGRAAGLGGLIYGIGRLAERLDRVQKLTRRGIEAEGLQRLGFAAQQSGADLEQVANAMLRANRAAAEAADGNTEYQEAFRALGIDVDEFARLDQEAQFLRVADAVAGATDENRAHAATLTLLGRAAGDLLPLLREGSEEIRAMSEGVKTLSQEELDAIAGARDALSRAKADIGAYAGAALGAVVLAFQAAVRAITTTVVQGVRLLGGLKEAAAGSLTFDVERARAGAQAASRAVTGAWEEVRGSVQDVYAEAEELATKSARRMGEAFGEELAGGTEAGMEALRTKIETMEGERAATELERRERELTTEELIARRLREREAALEAAADEWARQLEMVEGSLEQLDARRVELELGIKADALLAEAEKLEKELEEEQAKAAEAARAEERRRWEEFLDGLQETAAEREAEVRGLREGARGALGSLDRLTEIGLGAAGVTFGQDRTTDRLERLAETRNELLEEVLEEIAAAELRLEEDEF